MNRYMRIRQYNAKTKERVVLFPQAMTGNILRRDNGGVLENFLQYYDKHLANPGPHLNRATSTGTYRHLEAHIHNKVLVDGFPLLLKVHTNVECEPTLDFNGSGPKPIISGAGDRIPGGQCEGTTMFLLWSEEKDAWTLLSSDTYSDITKVVLPVVRTWTFEAQYDDQDTIVIPGFDHNSESIEINYGQTILRLGLDYEFVHNSPNAIRLLNFRLMEGDLVYFKITSYITTAKRGTFKYDLEVNDYPVTISEPDCVELDIPLPAIDVHALEINYEQTILRAGLDYTISDDKTKVRFNFPLQPPDIVTFHVTQFIEANGSIVPNNWGATGNYRYSLKVLHEEYTATEEHITVIPVPNYNYRKDELSVIRDNHLLVYDVDYTIDSLGQVVLLTSEMGPGDQLFFTILQGAMMDVPNFNVIDASGVSAQHLLLDMSYDQLCNHYTLLVRLKYDLETAPTAKCIDGPAEPIADCFGNPIYGGYKAGSFLWLVYNEDQHTWYSLGHGQMDITSRYPIYKVAEGEDYFLGGASPYPEIDENAVGEVTIPHGLGMKPAQVDIRPCEPPNLNATTGERTYIGDIWSYADEENIYVGNTGTATSKFHWTASTQEQTADLKTHLEKLIEEAKNRPGKFVTRLVTFDCPTDNTTTIMVDGFDSNLDKLVVNYGQTVLRESIDYNIVDGGIELINMELMIGDIVQFVIIVQEA
ncbi:MAG: hypothetical protein NC311_05535 [Muribaculaceae bacterium]|nr:hypothetical protein [Muribaculaceae bacterium]